MSPNKSAIVVRNLPRLTTTEDVKSFFDMRLRNADAFVYPLVKDTQKSAGNFLCTTVTINPARRRDALSFNGSDFVPAIGGGKSKIEIDDSFIGSITLAEHNNAQFDLYFVHGVGGDAFSSWVCDASGHMWPRDSLPEQCLNLGVRGRFSTLGYDAKVLDGGQLKTIHHAAESILKYIAADRPPGCTRPIFIVGHSLGGIVVEQALVLAFEKPAVKPEYAFIQHMVKGVAFFGTPFQGSRNADFISPVASIISGITRMNTNFITDLKTSSRELPELNMLFNHIKTEENFEVLLFVEKKADGPSKVTTRTSGTIPFRTEIAPVEIDANHRDMVKFKNANEARHSITVIVNMIKRKLGLEIIPTPDLTGSKEIISVLRLPDQVIGTIEKDKNAGFSQLARFDTIFVIDDTGSMQMAASSSEAANSNPRSRWDVLTKSLQYIANIASEHDKDGVDIHFLISSHLDQTNISNGQEVLNLLAGVDLEQGVGGTYLEPVLATILGPYVANYQEYFDLTRKRMKATKPKPLNIIVLTDGKDDDPETTEEQLVDIAKQLDEMHAPKSQVGVQFMQVGDDPEAAEYLKRLDNDLKTKYGVRDIVDTKTFQDLDQTQDFAQHLRCILLGAVNKNLD
ncbi:uncharacterized protein BP5553_06559 [Venustampulla echinocandica]|uniref:VWFA domain-containing protein n=1 Tax=Venustampulla echinocandica TaxID=2656787 RepID=A0A370TKB0_9HELO|nr:uncharacterized protein BP5553_06559 [Venustampulla echinocandica]RDL35947.1 hypothetical protein BP5553_06559 [Venustampulla echinocandica]